MQRLEGLSRPGSMDFLSPGRSDVSPPDLTSRLKGIKVDPGLTFDLAELSRRNQEVIANIGRKKAGFLHG